MVKICKRCGAVRPLCSFDFDDSEQVKKAFVPENHQWLTIEENLKKGSKYEENNHQR